MKRIVVIGGGISGMSAAQAAWELGGTIPGGLEVVVLEREREVGGKARSQRDGDWLFESGPSSVPGTEVAFDRMVRAAKLDAQRVASAPESARRFIVRGGKLRELAATPLGLVKNGVLSPLGALRLAGERFVAGRADARDESVYDFARRRLGSEAAERLARPLVNGVWAGDPHKLSLPAAFPRLLEFETRFGGLIRGVREIARMPQREREEAGTLSGPSQHTTLRDGLQSLPRALAAAGNFPVRCGVSARAVVRAPKEKGGWFVHADGGEPLHAEAVVLAGEAWA
ncbi:MAG: protoporphyrinogen oxidase, partial [Planctomycetota bacterium]